MLKSRDTGAELSSDFRAVTAVAPRFRAHNHDAVAVPQGPLEIAKRGAVVGLLDRGARRSGTRCRAARRHRGSDREREFEPLAVRPRRSAHDWLPSHLAVNQARLTRHGPQRLGLFRSPFSSKNLCSPTLNTKSWPHRVHVRISSEYTGLVSWKCSHHLRCEAACDRWHAKVSRERLASPHTSCYADFRKYDCFSNEAQNPTRARGSRTALSQEVLTRLGRSALAFDDAIHHEQRVWMNHSEPSRLSVVAAAGPRRTPTTASTSVRKFERKRVFDCPQRRRPRMALVAKPP
jgi:hypothetical protein